MSESTPQKETQPKYSTLAIVSLAAGIFGYILPIIGFIIALMTGRKAQKEIRESEGKLQGEKLAKAGIILAYIQLFLPIVAYLAFILFYLIMGWSLAA
ncbi:MAG: DUF4190 domain-containing protein [Chloroflexi bacterium]|nr:DUF4190 domain-containing protein [Chloroflexota bacterium]